VPSSDIRPGSHLYSGQKLSSMTLESSSSDKLEPSPKRRTRHSVSVVNLVRGRATKAEQVVVGVSVTLGPPKREAHFRWSTARHRLNLQTSNDKRSPKDIFIDCMLACVTGVENFRRKCPSAFDCVFTIVEGRNLSKNYTVGFSLAAFRAVATAMGFRPEELDGGLKGSGWAERVRPTS